MRHLDACINEQFFFQILLQCIPNSKHLPTPLSSFRRDLDTPVAPALSRHDPQIEQECLYPKLNIHLSIQFYLTCQLIKGTRCLPCLIHTCMCIACSFHLCSHALVQWEIFVGVIFTINSQNPLEQFLVLYIVNLL